MGLEIRSSQGVAGLIIGCFSVVLDSLGWEGAGRMDCIVKEESWVGNLEGNVVYVT